jgi:CubicO group peptidase (beta-lactamase class C family)
MAEGRAEEGFGLVQRVFEENLRMFGDGGASVCVRVGGRVVVDLWGGQKNDEEPWKEDSLVNVYSCTKAMCNLAILKLVDRGYISLDTPIASVWPAFGQNGKDSITLEQLLTHQAGLMTLRGIRLSNEDLEEWTAYLEGPMNGSSWLSELLSASPPFWEAGSGLFGYHPLVGGLYLSEVCRRVDPKHRR